MTEHEKAEEQVNGGSKNLLKAYFSDTHNLLYSYLLSLPLLLLYEALILIAQPGSDQMVRISVDVWLKSMFNWFGLNALNITLILVAFAGLFILYKERELLRRLRFSYFAYLLLEATFYALIVALITQSLVGFIVNMAQSEPFEQLTFFQQIALSLGAGLYEELFFRVILVTLLIKLFSLFFTKEWASNSASIILAAMLFSAVHYVGSFGDAFTIGSFLYRFLFGLFLNGIYVKRGFGVTAWTHAIYDLMVIAFL